jgi:CheY-like chemotaxis protein
VRHLVELHGGSVSVSSPGVGKGAVFSVELPFRSTRSGSPPAADFPAPYEARQAVIDEEQRFAYPPVLKGYRLLVVEDEADALDMIGTMLDRCKAEVRRASSVAEALELLKDWKPDVVVSDIEMPGEDGYSFIRKIRSAGNGSSRLPAVALTAHARAEDRIQALAAGFDAHVAKPIEPQELVTVIASLAKR